MAREKNTRLLSVNRARQSCGTQRLFGDATIYAIRWYLSRRFATELNGYRAGSWIKRRARGNVDTQRSMNLFPWISFPPRRSPLFLSVSPGRDLSCSPMSPSPLPGPDDCRRGGDGDASSRQFKPVYRRRCSACLPPRVPHFPFPPPPFDVERTSL